MRFISFASLAVFMGLAGCAKIDITDTFLSRRDIQVLSQSTELLDKNDNDLFPNLTALANQVRGDDVDHNRLEGLLHSTKVAPDFVTSDPLTSQYILAVDAARKGVSSTIVLTDKNLGSFRKMLKDNITVTEGASKAGLTADGVKHPFVNRVRSYLAEYYGDEHGFVQRDGASLKRIDPKGFLITNDQIIPVVKLFFEALMDEALQNPAVITVDATKPTTFHKYQDTFRGGCPPRLLLANPEHLQKSNTNTSNLQAAFRGIFQNT